MTSPLNISENDTVIRDSFDVEVIAEMGSDQLICEAARVSTLGTLAPETEESFGLINYLMKNRHGSPFEHGSVVFRIFAPIVVWREFMRHRIGFSYNEQSGRYMELANCFYIPPQSRYLVQSGKAGAYIFAPGTPDQYEAMTRALLWSYRVSWNCYQAMLEENIAKEVARMCLPVGIYSAAYVTCNPRSLMSFLSLRTKVEGSTFPSSPQWEINQVANAMESIFANLWPLTHRAFVENGRVAP